MSRSGARHRRINAPPPALSSYDNSILADGPSAYLPLAGGGSSGASDRSGNGHSGLPYNNPTSSTFLNGDKAVLFDGFTQYIEIPDDDIFSVTTTGALTLEMWIRPDTYNFPTIEEPTYNPPTYIQPYVYFAGKDPLPVGQSEWACRMYSRMETWSTADWKTFANIDPPRPNRISGYAFNPSGGLGAGSYFQDSPLFVDNPVNAGEWIYYVLVINTANASSSYPGGYTKVYRDGLLRDQDALNVSPYFIVPVNGTANVRIGTNRLRGFFQGAMAKFAVYNYELSANAIHNHYRLVVPPVTGSAQFIGHVGDATSTTTGTIVEIVVGAGGVSAGSTLIIKVAHVYTSGGPTMADTPGNTYTRDFTTADAALSFRISLFSAQINAPLNPGDVIRVTMSAAVDVKMMSVDQFAQITFTTPLEGTINGASSGNSTTPGNNKQVTTTNADDLIIGVNAILGPLSDTYGEDTADEFIGLTRVGASGSIDLTTNSAYKTVAFTGAYKYRPTSSPARSWLALIAAYKAGTAVVTPPTIGTVTFLQFVGSASSTVSGTTLTITVVSEEGIPVGSTLIVRTVSSFTSTNPTVSDSKGNGAQAGPTYTRDRSAADSGSNLRAAVFSCAIQFALVAGDTITVHFNTTVAVSAATVDAFSNVAGPIVVDAQNGTSGNSTSPTVTTPATSQADDLILGMVAVGGPTSDVYYSDVPHHMTSLTRVGTNGGSGDLTIDSGYRAVNATGTYTFNPTLGTARPFVVMNLAYKAGAPITPPAGGTAAFVKNLDATSNQTSGTTLTITIPAGGVAAGNTVIVKAFGDYTANGPTVTDNHGNTYTRDRQGASTGNVTRIAVYSFAATSGLSAGDTITLTWATAINTRVAVADEFSGVLQPIALDGTPNGNTNTSTTPLVSITTTVADALIVSAVGVTGDTSETFSNDDLNHWTNATRIGSTGVGGGGDRTLNSGYRSILNTGTYTYNPTLGTSELWLTAIVAYRGG